MLVELRIRNFALIEELALRLGPGLNVLSGETGAGKSIIVGALSLLLGERASADVIRAGAERASIEGVFELGEAGALGRLLDERGFEMDAGGLLILKREVAAEGRNRAWINGSPATATVLGEIGAALVDLHGQHEHQTLLRRDEQRSILDAYAGAGPLVDDVATAHSVLREVRNQIETLAARRRDVEQRAEFLRFRADEIEVAGLDPAEEEALEAEARRLGQVEDLMAAASLLHAALSEGSHSIVSAVAALRRPLEQLARIDPRREPLQEIFDTGYYALEELAGQVESYAETLEHDPRRLEEIRSRLDLLFRLKSKYGQTLADVVEVARQAREELDLIDSGELDLNQLRTREIDAASALQQSATQLTEVRRAAAERLEAEISAVLPELGMQGGTFRAALLPVSAPGAAGAEDIEFQISINAGHPLRPLAQVASGGELSRVMLALKTTLARVDAVPTLVFDEVDAGIGGRVATQVGAKMREVAGHHQVFAITHLPQIASRAHIHLLVEKADHDGRAVTTVQLLEADARVREIARMLGGDADSDVSLRHARELLERGAW